MQPWIQESENQDYVEAIEEGKIVKVPKNYAILEGLPILRKYAPPKVQEKEKQEETPHLLFDDFRKPLKPKSQVLLELIENFHWQISKKRRELGLTRRQLAKKTGEPDYHIKMLENGILPKDDFVIVNKIQSALNLNLRKDQKDFSQSPRSLIKDEPKQEKARQKEITKERNENKSQTQDQELKNLAGSDIEIIE